MHPPHSVTVELYSNKLNWIDTRGDLCCETNSGIDEKLLSRCVAMSGSNGGFVVLKENGDVYGYGDNSEGQLSGGASTCANIIRRVYCINNIAQISMGCNFLLCLNTEGVVWGCGGNAHQQLGNGYARLYTPRPIEGLPCMRYVFAGGKYTSHAIDLEGKYWRWGEFTGGRIEKVGGIFNDKQILQITEEWGANVVLLDANNKLWRYSYQIDSEPEEMPVPTEFEIIQLVANRHNDPQWTEILDIDKNVYHKYRKQDWFKVDVGEPIQEIHGNNRILYKTIGGKLFEWLPSPEHAPTFLIKENIFIKDIIADKYQPKSARSW